MLSTLLVEPSSPIQTYLLIGYPLKLMYFLVFWRFYWHPSISTNSRSWLGVANFGRCFAKLCKKNPTTYKAYMHFPPFCKIGRSFLYRMSQIGAFILTTCLYVFLNPDFFLLMELTEHCSALWADYTNLFTERPFLGDI